MRRNTIFERKIRVDKIRGMIYKGKIVGHMVEYEDRTHEIFDRSPQSPRPYDYREVLTWEDVQSVRILTRTFLLQNSW